MSAGLKHKIAATTTRRGCWSRCT